VVSIVSISADYMGSSSLYTSVMAIFLDFLVRKLQKLPLFLAFMYIFRVVVFM